MPSTLRMGSRGEEVRLLQTLLNRALRPGPNLVVDGVFGPRTYQAVASFQRQQGLLADGMAGASTWTALEPFGVGNSSVAPSPSGGSETFPLRQRPALSYQGGERYFGAPRSETRVHAACDLVVPAGTPVFAVADGTVIQMPTLFYEGTYELQIRHADFIVRYGEVSNQIMPGVRLGAAVRRGQQIATVGLNSRSGGAMLHFEMYRGTAGGALTQRENRIYDFVPNRPYERRRDLLDPTPYLDRWPLLV